MVSAIGLLLFPLVSFAAPATGSLIKGSSSAVYYFAIDGKRYVFPTEKTYFTWYDNFDDVVTITDEELASIPLGANVTYRPGTRMVKIDSDPKVYAVAKGGLLRWVESESLAESLYGPNWATHIDDIPVGFFTSYTLGTSIAGMSDYNPTDVINASPSIQVDRGLLPPEPSPEPVPTPEPTIIGLLTASDDSVTVGEAIDVLATANPSATIQEIYIYLDDEEQRYCTYSPCGTSVTIPVDKTEYALRAEFTWITGETDTKIIPITVTGGDGNGVTLNITNPELKPSGTLEAIVSVDSSIIASIIQIYLDGEIVKICDNTQECRYVANETGSIGDTHGMYARVQNQGGSVVFSSTKTIQVVENDHPQIDLRVGQNYIFTGETIDVATEASDTDGVASTSIWYDGLLIKECNISICTTLLGPFSSTGTQMIVGKAVDTQGLEQTANASFEVR